MHKKNSKRLRRDPTQWTCGPRTKCIFNSTVRVVECGSRQKLRIPSYSTLQPAKAWAILAPSDCAMAGFYFVAKRVKFNGAHLPALSSRSASRQH